MGFFSSLFGGGGGGGGGYTAPPKPQLSEMGKWSQKALYGDVERALAGGGLLPSGYPQIRKAYGKAYQKAQPELEGWLRRTVPKEDVKVRGFARGMLSREYYGGLQELKEAEEVKPYEEQEQAIGLGLSLLGQEKGISADITQMYNQYLTQQAGMPTFGGELAGGLGGAAGWATAAQRYGQLMSGTKPAGGTAGGGVPSQFFSPTGAQALTNLWLQPGGFR